MSFAVRRIEPSDLQATCKTFMAHLNAYLADHGKPPYVDLEDPAAWGRVWEEERRSLFEHVSAHEGEGWLAEDQGQVLGYARAIRREGVLQLTEFFTHPERRDAGVGKAVLARAFEQAEADARIVIATTHPAALARYLKAGVHPIGTVFDFEKAPEPVDLETDLTVEALSDAPGALAAVNDIDRVLLGYRREVEHRWLMTDRRGFLYRRDGAPVGYGYIGRWSGPFALLEPTDFPAVLALAETEAARHGAASFPLMVPTANRSALAHVVARGFRIEDGHTMIVMTDKATPLLDRYLVSLPGLFV